MPKTYDDAVLCVLLICTIVVILITCLFFKLLNELLLVVIRSTKDNPVKLVYVSGKYRDPRGPYYIKQNIRIAEDVGIDLWNMGYAVIVPHKNTEFLDGAIDDPAFIAGDCEMIKRCDVMVIIPNWRTSAGALVEIKTALECKIPVFYWELEEDRRRIAEYVKGKYEVGTHILAQAALHEFMLNKKD